MNPVTQSLIDHVSDPQVIALVEHWDAVEALAIRVYRRAAARSEDEAEFSQVIGWLRENHNRWQAALEPFWRGVTIKGVGPAASDPFQALLTIDSASEFVNNWDAMRILPAIRQAINEWLLTLARVGR
jgi:hypothetical protein